LTSVIDTSVLLFFLNDQTSPPIDPATGVQVTECGARIDFLLKKLERSKAAVIVPAPVLAEVLVRAGAAGPEYLQILERERSIVILEFGKRAAVEAGAMLARLRSDGHKTVGGDARAKLKFDVMIAAIAKVHGANTVYSDDPDIRQLGRLFGYETIGVGALPLPPVDPQGSLALSGRALDLGGLSSDP
jgi:predicted nucleic acid-binding protein